MQRIKYPAARTGARRGSVGEHFCNRTSGPRKGAASRRSWGQREVFHFYVFSTGMKFTSHKMNHFKVNISVVFITFSILHSCHVYLDRSKTFSSPQSSPLTHEPLLPRHLLPQPLETTNLLLSLWIRYF